MNETWKYGAGVGSLKNEMIAQERKGKIHLLL
jgi:hypothetical protein